ncbi:MAG: GNAT family N-acetyltransferase [Proteobacteria bacterium]|nr:MAG: GNAT family N-acetyltransferase [Pseudomonadota bacterium]
MAHLQKPHPLFQAERLDLESYLRSLSTILKDDLVFRSKSDVLSTRSTKGSGIGFLNRSILEGTHPQLARLLIECKEFCPENRIDIFYPSEDVRTGHSQGQSNRLNDFYEIDSKIFRRDSSLPSDYLIDDECSPEDYTDKILALSDRSSITHQIFVAMSQRPETQRFTVRFQDRLIAAASYTLIEGGILKLSGVQVDEEYRNQGLQKILIKHRIHHAFDRFDFDKIYSIAKRDSVSGKNLEKMGFIRSAVFEFGP